MKKLYLVRHAKAESYSDSGEDFDREINDKGRKRIAHVGEYLKSSKIAPDIILTSSSARTLQTVDRLEPWLPERHAVKQDKRLYLASAAEILNEIRHIDDRHNAAMVVGHNPGLHELAFSLARHGPEELLTKLSMKFPTGAMAGISFDVKSWSDVSMGGGRLTHCAFPSDFYDED